MKKTLTYGSLAVLLLLGGSPEVRADFPIVNVFYISADGDCTNDPCSLATSRRTICRNSAADTTLYVCDTDFNFYVAIASGGGGGSPGGSNTHVQFNDSAAFGGDAGLTFNTTTDVLTAGGGLIVNAGSVALPAGTIDATEAIASFAHDNEHNIFSTTVGGSEHGQRIEVTASNGVITPLVLQVMPTTAANNDGVALNLEQKNSAGTRVVSAQIASTMTNVTAGSETSTVDISLRVAGGTAVPLRLTSEGITIPAGNLALDTASATVDGKNLDNAAMEDEANTFASAGSQVIRDPLEVKPDSTNGVTVDAAGLLAKAGTGSVRADDLAAGAVNATTDVAGGLCGTNQILEDQGAAWACINTPVGGGGASFGTIGTAVADIGGDALTVTDSATIDFTTTDAPEDLTASVTATVVLDSESPAAADIGGTFAAGLTVNTNAVALTTDTTGNYVSSATTSQGLLLTGTEGASLGLIDCAGDEVLRRNTGDTAWECVPREPTKVVTICAAGCDYATLNDACAGETSTAANPITYRIGPGLYTTSGADNSCSGEASASFIGAGMGVTTIKVDGGFNALDMTGSDDITISDMTLTGQRCLVMRDGGGTSHVHNVDFYTHQSAGINGDCFILQSPDAGTRFYLDQNRCGVTADGIVFTGTFTDVGVFSSNNYFYNTPAALAVGNTAVYWLDAIPCRFESSGDVFEMSGTFTSGQASTTGYLFAGGIGCAAGTAAILGASVIMSQGNPGAADVQNLTGVKVALEATELTSLVISGSLVDLTISADTVFGSARGIENGDQATTTVNLYGTRVRTANGEPSVRWDLKGFDAGSIIAGPDSDWILDNEMLSGDRSRNPRASAPSVCTVGDKYMNTSGAYNICTATNTWSTVAHIDKAQTWTAAQTIGTGGSVVASGSGTITATDGDSATSFFSAGTIDEARLDTNVCLDNEASTWASAGSQVFNDPVEIKPDAANGVTVNASGLLAKTGTGSVQADDVVCATCVADGELVSNYSGIGGCTNQFARTLNDNAAPTCATVDISGDTNLTAGRSLTITGDDVAADAELFTDTKCINIDPAATTTDWFFFRAETAITVTGIDCIVDAATSVVLTLRECDANGGTCGATEAAITCATTNTTEASTIDDSAVDAGDWMRVLRGTVTGSPTQATLCFTFTLND